jgi:hypothetical protein
VAFEGVKLQAEFGALDLSHARPYLAREPPDLGPLEGTAHLSDLDGTLGVEEFRVRGGREGVFRIDVSGVLDHLRAVEQVEVQARLSARDLTVLGELVGSELPPIGPVEFRGEVKGSGEMLVSTGTARLDQTSLSGRWRASFAEGSRPSVSAVLSSPHIHLDDIGIAPEYFESAKAKPRPAAPRRLEDAPDPFEGLRALDADVTLRAERLSGRLGTDMSDVELRLHLDRGELVAELASTWEGGSVEARAEVDARMREPKLALRGEIRGMDMTRAMAQVEQETEFAGLVDLVVDLRTAGATAAQLRSNLEGSFVFMIREGTLASEFARRFVVNFTGAVLPGFRAPEVASVSCGIAAFSIESGVAEVETLLLQSDRIDVVGTGRIDVAGDRYDLRMTPRVRDPGLVSVAVTVDVHGPLADPSYTPVPRTFATSLAQGIATNALRPAAGLVRLFRGESERNSACRQPLPGLFASGSGGG